MEYIDMKMVHYSTKCEQKWALVRYFHNFFTGYATKEHYYYSLYHYYIHFTIIIFLRIVAHLMREINN